jgi:tryptophan-rich sensory protein
MMIISVGICLLVGSLAARFEPGLWYQALARPVWTPPSWVFAPVWTALYILMGLAAWLVWRQSGLKAAALPLSVFLIQLIMNGIWSWIFFGQHNIGLAFAEIILLWFFILITLVLFWKKSPLAGLFLLPYLLWVSFAAALNFAFWRLN